MHIQDITSITAEQAAFVLPRLAAVGFKPNEAGEIVTGNDDESDRLQGEIAFALGQHERTRPQRRVVVVEGFKSEAPKRHPLNPAAIHDLMQYGFLDEGRAFPVAGDHSLSLVRAAVRDLGGDWRLWASVEDDGGEDCAPRFRCIVGRADVWPYPSSVEAVDEVHGKGPTVTVEIKGTDLMRGVLEKATSDVFKASRLATELPHRATATAAAAITGADLLASVLEKATDAATAATARGLDLKPGEFVERNVHSRPDGTCYAQDVLYRAVHCEAPNGRLITRYVPVRDEA